jgi:hypothetical protein
MASAGAAGTQASAAMMNAGTNATKTAADIEYNKGRLNLDTTKVGNDFANSKGNTAANLYATDRQWDYNNRALDNKIDSGSLGNTFGNMAIGAAGNWLQNGGFNTIGTGLSNLWNNAGQNAPGSNTTIAGSGGTAGGYGGQNDYGVNAPTSDSINWADYPDYTFME